MRPTTSIRVKPAKPMSARGLHPSAGSDERSASGVYSADAATEVDSARRAHSRWALLRNLKITFTGLLALVVVILVGLAALNSEANLLFLLFSLSVGLVVFAAIIPLFMVRWIEVERVVPRAAVAGRVLPVAYVVRNHGRWGSAWGLVIEESESVAALQLPRAFVSELPAHARARVELMAHCPRRGRYMLKSIRVRSSFPLSLFSCEVVFPAEAEIMVYPPLGSLRGNPWRDQRWADAQTPRQRRAGPSAEELDGLREYREGDPVRLIHWRRSAHAGDLLVRDTPPVQTTQLVVLLDPWPDAGPGGAGKLERRTKTKEHRKEQGRHDREVELVISVAATAACDALERGHRVGLIARGRVPIIIAPGGGRMQRQRLLHELTMLRPGTPEPMDELASRIRWSSGWHARCLLCTTNLGVQHRRLMRFLGRRAETLAVAAPGTPWLDSVFVPAPAVAPGPHAERRRA